MTINHLKSQADSNYCLIYITGPSFAVDTACSSSLQALDQAMLALRTGQCDSAIVAGASLCLKPGSTLQFQKLGMLAPDGTCKSYDITGEGAVSWKIEESYDNQIFNLLI